MDAVSSTVKAIIAAAVIALIAGVFVWTYKHGYSTAEAVGTAQLATYKQQQQAGEAEAASAAFGRYALDVQRSQAAEADFVKRQTDQANQTQTLKGQIDAVTKPHFVAQPDGAAAPVADCQFTRGFVRLWNAAAGTVDPGDRAVQAGSGVAAAAGDSGTDAAACSGVSQGDVLDWVVDYANRARTVESQLIGVADSQPKQ